MQKPGPKTYAHAYKQDPGAMEAVMNEKLHEAEQLRLAVAEQLQAKLQQIEVLTTSLDEKTDALAKTQVCVCTRMYV
jgi:hypothetical protein